MRFVKIFILCLLSFTLGIVLVKPPLASYFHSIDWANQKITNIAAIVAALGTLSAVIVALIQSHEAKSEALTNREIAIEEQKEKLNLYNNILISPPDMVTFHIGISATNNGLVPVNIQHITAITDDAQVAMSLPNNELPKIIPPGSSETFIFSHKLLMSLSRYCVEYCNSNPHKIKFVISTNLSKFDSDLHIETINRITKLISEKRDFLMSEIENSKNRQQEYDSKKNDDAWLSLFSST